MKKQIDQGQAIYYSKTIKVRLKSVTNLTTRVRVYDFNSIKVRLKE